VSVVTTAVALSIAGSDSGAGAGVQADLKTFHALGVYGLTAVTAVTAQNTAEVRAIQPVSPEVVRDQLECLLEDFPVRAVKIGMIPSAEVADVVAGALRSANLPVVLDPVMVATSGGRLVEDDQVSAVTRALFPLAGLLTPNLAEASALVGRAVRTLEAMQEAARELLSLGPARVVVKGGHLEADQATDVYCDADTCFALPGELAISGNTHGSGCTFASAIAAALALGSGWPDAVRVAKRFVTEAIRRGPPLGRGHGPVNQFFGLEPYRTA
jgi:hydroxymethylpyrimidine/phosphomethylpyrimidine kinase